MRSVEVVNCRISALSQRKADPLHDKIMEFAAFLEGGLAQRFVPWPTNLLRTTGFRRIAKADQGLGWRHSRRLSGGYLGVAI
jgi:hypothetical protein